jgi:hypothetical protein
MSRTDVRRALGSARRRLGRVGGRLFAPVGLATEYVRAARTRAAIAAVNQRPELARRFPGPRTQTARVSVVAVVTHLADPARPVEWGVERVARTVEGLVEALGHTDLEIVLNTMPGRHVGEALPDHLRTRVDVREHDIDDPMFLGFEAQQEFVRRAQDADWFLYTEDDVVLTDSLVLEKLAFFNDAAPADTILLPHRYELWRGRRTYIDLVSKTSAEIGPWLGTTVIEAGGWKFAEFENPHSGWYCLSRSQLDRWLATGRRWFGEVSFVAARESAATGCLAEAFRLYKPHPDNMTYLEVRHWDTKYSQQHARIHGERSPT